MPALNFSAQFATLVEDGDKRQTIRAPRKDGRPHCKVGDTIKLYTGMRTKSCRLLREGRVMRIDQVRLNSIDMFLNGCRLPMAIYDRSTGITDNEFARADGFEGYTELAEWFAKTHSLPFEGVVIYWD